MLSLILALLLFNSCGNDSKPTSYEAFVCGFSDSTSSAEAKIEYEFVDKESFPEKPEALTRQITINSETFSAEFKEISFMYAYDYYPMYFYEDTDENQFYFDDKGDLIQYFDKDYYHIETFPSIPTITESEAIEKAKAFLGELVNISDYRISVSSEQGRLFTVKFQYYIGEVETTEKAWVYVGFDGNVCGMSSSMLGRISNLDIDITDLDFEKIESLVIEKLDKIYADAKKTYDRVKYDTSVQLLTILKDGKRGIVFPVDVDCDFVYSDGSYSTTGSLTTIVVEVS